MIERTESNLKDLIAYHSKGGKLNVQPEVTELDGGNFQVKFVFYAGTEYAGFADIFFQSDDVITITNHVMEDEHQNKGSYKLLCKLIPVVGRQLGYRKARIASPPGWEPEELKQLHERSGFKRVNPTAMEVDISKEDSEPEKYARS